MFFAAILTLLLGTAMSASILHKEIDIGHNGVHYKVTVDAEKYHTDHSLDDIEDDSSETEHHGDVGKIGLHYEVPHTGQHHHEEEGKHHGVVLHIELGNDIEEHHDTEHHGSKQHEEHHDEHHGSKQHEEHHEFPEYENTKQDWKQHWSFAHHGSKQNDELEHGLEHQEPEHLELDHIQSLHGLIHKPISHGTGKHHIGYTQKHLGQFGHGNQQWGHLGGEHYGIQTGEYPVGQPQGNLWHLLHPSPIQIQGGITHTVPFEQEGHYGFEQGQPIGQPLLGFEVLHAMHHPELHH